MQLYGKPAITIRSLRVVSKGLCMHPFAYVIFCFYGLLDGYLDGYSRSAAGGPTAESDEMGWI